ncbi:MAG TPA: alpha/beta fold hydrolase, partial [Blastococcus sp.]
MAQPATDTVRTKKPAQTSQKRAAPGPAEPPEDATEAVMGLDMLLVDAARGPIRRMIPPVGTALRFGSALARQPRTVAKRTNELVREMGKVAVGSSELEPGKKDKRFADPAWTGNPVLRRAMQAHLATARTAWELIDDADLDWQDDERIRFTATNVVDALAPSNVPVLNPLSLKAVIDTGGRSAVQGLRRMLRDLTNPPRVPSMVEPDAFTVGEDLAATPGSVVFRTDVFELIQYRPTTETVRAVPLLMVPPTINKFYIADLAPGRSIVEHYLSAGQQVFMISWRNPDERHAAWDLDTYGQAIIDAMDAVELATGSEQVAIQAFCSGGIITAMVLAHLAATGRQDRVSAVSYAVTVLDWARAGTVSALMDEESVKAATEKSRKKGYLDGAQLAEVFAWLRPNDLVWNYWVNNYLQGKPPPNFDILFWNADTTRMSAGLHRDFIDIAIG